MNLKNEGLSHDHGTPNHKPHGSIPWNKKGGTEYGTHTRASNASSFRNMGYLRDAKSRMENSLLRISSGKKILSAADDPGGLALSMRLTNELSINNVIQNNVENSKSFVEMQDSALETAGDILIEMDRLKSSIHQQMQLIRQSMPVSSKNYKSSWAI